MKNIRTYEELIQEQEGDLWLDSQLQEAVAAGDVKKAEELLKSGANPNTSDTAKQTVLHHAVQEDNDEMVKLLIDFGANVHAKDEFSQKPIHWAAFSNSPKSAVTLIENGADINSITPRGVTPLMWSVEYDHPEVAKILINAGVDPLSYFSDYAEFLEFFDSDILWWKDITPELRNASKRMMRSSDLFGED